MPRLSVRAIAICFISLCIGTLLACSTPISVGGSGANLHVGSADTFNAKGGVKLTATLICPVSVTCDVGSLLKPTLQRIAQRVQNDTVQNAYLATSQDASGAYQLVMELPATNNQDAAYGYVATGAVRFIDTGDSEVPVTTSVDPGQYPVVFTGSDLDKSSIKVSTNQEGQPQIDFAMQGSAKQRFADYTANHIGKYLTITLDWMVIESATIQSEITGPGEISGDLSSSSASSIASLMKSDPLPLAPMNIKVTDIPARA